VDQTVTLHTAFVGVHTRLIYVVSSFVSITKRQSSYTPHDTFIE
jgi:hypothetical protein